MRETGYRWDVKSAPHRVDVCCHLVSVEGIVHLVFSWMFSNLEFLVKKKPLPSNTCHLTPALFSLQ